MNKQIIAALLLAGICAACSPSKDITSFGTVEKLDPSLDQIISTDAKIEVLGSGYTWSEGPVWVESQKMLLFSDVPQDTVYKWTAAKGVEVYLTPSGYTGNHPEMFRERGSNGLILNDKGQLVLCMTGDRRIAVMDAPLDHPEPRFISLANLYQGKKFNSPNDAVYDKSGNLYITDPPYGLKRMEHDSAKEIPFQGIYKVFPNGKVILLIDTITRPNGIALSPDHKFLYIGNSDGAKANWYRYELGDSGVVSGKIFYDATSISQSEKNGAPDGMKVDSHGNIFGSGPGGIFIINPEGKLIGRLKIPGATANCAFSPDEKTLFITSKDKLLSVKLK